MKRKSLLFALLLALFMPWAANAQTRATQTFDFEDNAIPSTWTNDATYPWVVTDAKNHTDRGAYCIKSSIERQNSKTSSIEATFNFLDDGSISFYCWASCESASNYWDYGIFYIDGTQMDRFLHVTDWVYKTYTVDAGTHTFKWTYTKDSSAANNDDCFYVDDIVVDLGEAQAFPKPTGLAVSNVLHNEATLSWTENGTATAWQIGYTADGGTEQYVSVTENPYTLTGLTPLTTYEIRVQADYQDNTYSLFSNSISFSTTAEAEAVGDGWSDDFEGETCGWELINGDLADAWVWGTATNNGGTHAIYISDDGGTTWNYSHNSVKVFAAKLLTFTEGKFTFSYDWNCYGESNYDFLRVALVPASQTLTAGSDYSTISTTSLTGWIALDGGKLNQVQTWQNKEVTINVSAGNYYLVFAWRSDSSTQNQPPAAVDNVSITKIACDHDVTDLSVSNITTTGATLSWEGGEARQWQVVYSTASNFENAIEEIVDNNAYDLTRLDNSTIYYVKVRAYCGGEDYGSWSETISFATACESIAALGYSENFDSYELSSTYTPSSRTLPVCWNYINECTNSSYMYYPTVYYYSYTDYSHSSPNSLRFYSYYSSYGSYDPQPQYAILPPMEDLAGLQVTLMARGYNASSTFKIGTMSNPTDASTFTLIAEQELTDAYPEEPFVYLIPSDCRDNYLAIMIDAANSSRSTNGVYIDDIVISEVPSCAKPTNLAVDASTITNDGATITWTAGGDETQWLIEFATDANFTRPFYETVEDEPTYTFHGLDGATTYYVHVKAVCGGSNGSSEYNTVPVSFTTLQNPVNLPYANDFERENDWLFVNGNLTNAWAYGEATSNGEGTHALYISNDDGTTNAYTNNSAAMVYATKAFNFEAGIYVFSYDWKANGESSYDYLRVALVPSSVQLAASTSYPSGFGTTNLPTGWIALDGGSKLNLSTEWQSFASGEIEITSGTYMMVFAWRDDTSGGTNPPAAIDNVSIEIITCTTPTGLDAPESGVTATSAQLSWTETGEATAWEIMLTDENDNTLTIPVTEEDLVDGVYTIASLTPVTVYTAKVRANCGDGYSHWSEETTFETASECPTLDGLAAEDITSNSAVISWNGYGHEEFNLRYSTDGETWTTERGVANNYMLADLTPATTYYVQVQPTCANEDTWSDEYSFTTQCDAIVVTETWNEGFENGLSVCWSQDGDGTWTVGTGDYSTTTGAHTGTYNARITHGTTGAVTKLITPVLDLTSLNNPMLTFWYINRSWSGDIDNFAVYYRTASDATWTQIDATEEAHATWTKATYMLPETNATYQIAFEMTDGYGYGVGIDDITIQGTVTVTLDILGVGEDDWNSNNNSGYYLIASPMMDAITPSEDNGFITEDFDLYYFDEGMEGIEWRNYHFESFDIVPGKGYIYASKTDTQLQFTGVPNTNGEVTLQKTDGNPFEGWNLVGNPFNQTAYLPAGRTFYTMDYDQNLIVEVSQGDERNIEAMQAVFVVAEEDGETIIFSTTAPEAKSAMVALNLNNRNGLIDRAIIRFDKGSTMPKLQLKRNSTKLYIPQDGNDYAVVRSEGMGAMPVNFKAESNGSYTITLSTEEVSFAYLHLIDKVANIDVDLLANPSYSFDALTTDFANRFELVFATSNCNDDNFAFFNNGSFVINNSGDATLQVIDVNGRVLTSENINGCANVNVNAAAGVYMIRLVNGDNVKVQKVVVR